MYFPISGVDINPLMLAGVAFIISFFASIAGLSGAFLLLPFQVSVLKFTSPAVSPTNLVFNVIAIPGGVYRYYREGRMVWPLTWVIITGTIPGILIGAILRIRFFSGARTFKFFVGWVLLYMGYRLIGNLLGRTATTSEEALALEEDLKRRTKEAREEGSQQRFSGLPAKSTILVTEMSFHRISYDFYGHTFSFNPLVLFVLSLFVGVVGGIYGIGGGAIIAPFIVTFFGLPVYTIAGATLMSTFATSSAGILVYLYLAYSYAGSGMAIAPDWLLGASFGVGGFGGVYLGARIQRFVGQKIIKAVLGVIIMVLAFNYIFGFFR